MVKTKRNKFDSGTFFFSLSSLPNVVCSYLLIFILLMFNIPMHASKNAVERNRSLFFSLFRPKPGVTIVPRRIQLLLHADADSTGAHFQSRALSTVPSQERASVPKMGIHHNYIFGLCKLWEFIIIFLWLCRFIVVVFLYFFPLYFPPYLPWQFPSLRLYVLSLFSPFYFPPP